MIQTEMSTTGQKTDVAGGSVRVLLVSVLSFVRLSTLKTRVSAIYSVRVDSQYNQPALVTAHQAARLPYVDDAPLSDEIDAGSECNILIDDFTSGSAAPLPDLNRGANTTSER